MTDQETALKTRSLGSLLAAEFPARSSLLAPWLTERHLSLIYAQAGAGKTFVSLSVALAVAAGGRYLDWDAPSPRRVLFVDGEMDIEDLRDRCAILLPALGGSATTAKENLRFLAQQDQRMDVQFPDLASEDGQRQLLSKVSAFQPDLVILDNFSTLCEVEDENNASSFNPVLNLMRQLKQGRVAVILVHHSRKDGNSYRGTSKMAVIFNSIFALGHPNGVPSTQGAHFELRWEKYRGLRDGRVRNLDVRLSDGRWSHEPLTDDQLEQMVTLIRTLDYPDQESLAARLGVAQGTISKLKRKAVAQKLITEHEWSECLKGAREMAREDAPDLKAANDF